MYANVLLAVGSVEDHVDRVVGQLLDRRAGLHADAAQHALELLHVVRVHRRVTPAAQRPAPRNDRALGDGLAAIGDHLPRVDLDLLAEAGARRTRPVGRVERKEARRQLFERESAVDAGEGLAIGQLARRLPGRLGEHRDDAAREPQRRLDGIGETLADLGLHHEAIDHHLDRVLALLVERDRVATGARRGTKLLRLAVHANAGEALFRDLLEELRVLALAAANERRQDHEARSLGQLRDRVEDLLAGLRADLAPALIAVRRADARVKQPEIVVDLGDGADRRTRVAGGRLLIDRDRRREAFDVVDVGLLHLSQELPRVRRQRLYVAALSFGVDRVERQRRLARAREAGHHDEPVSGQHEIDVLEVVLARALDDDGV